MSKSNITFLKHCPLPGRRGEAWNIVVGCTPAVLPNGAAHQGCLHCWSREVHTKRYMAEYWQGKPSQYMAPFAMVQCAPTRSDEPLHWNKPRLVMVCSGSDFFHAGVRDAFRLHALATIAMTPDHEYLIFTKRPQEARRFLTTPVTHTDWWHSHALMNITHPSTIEDWPGVGKVEIQSYAGDIKMPPNLGLICSVSDQASADAMLPELLRCPASWHGVSYEPAVGPVDFAPWLQARGFLSRPDGVIMNPGEGQRISLVIAGCESGPDRRPADADWFRDVRDACAASGVAFYLKQSESMPGCEIPWGSGPDTIDRRLKRVVVDRPYLDGKQHLAWPGQKEE